MSRLRSLAAALALLLASPALALTTGPAGQAGPRFTYANRPSTCNNGDKGRITDAPDAYHVANGGSTTIAVRCAANTWYLDGARKLVLWRGPVARCQVGTTALNGWNSSTVGNYTVTTQTCFPVTATNLAKDGFATMDGSTHLTALFTDIDLPADWDVAGKIDIDIWWVTTAAASGGGVRFTIGTKCFGSSAYDSSDLANFTNATDSQTASNALVFKKTTITGVTVTGCAAGQVMTLAIGRIGDDAADTETQNIGISEVVVTGYAP
jgi:hypothetical protein